MSTKPSELLHRLPSVSELLEKPPIRALVGRWNRSRISAELRSFLDEVREDLERRALDAGVPSIRELTERAARYVSALDRPLIRPAINASGSYFGGDCKELPVCDEALERQAACGGSFVVAAGRSPIDAAANLLARLTGCEAATVVHSYSGAVGLALAAVAGGREAIIARAEMGSLAGECPLTVVADSVAVRWREVGRTNQVTALDFEQAITAETAAIVRHLAEDYRIVGETAEVELETLVALAREHELPLAHLLGRAALVGGLPLLPSSLPSAGASLAEGVSLVVMRGDGLLGGPPCGILLGTRETILAVESQPMFNAWRVTPTRLAALVATLECYDDPRRLEQSVPLYQALSTTAANLLQRTDRLAPQMAQAADVRSAEVIATQPDLGIPRWSEWTLPSSAIALVAEHGDAAALEKRLRQAAIPVVTRRDGDRVLIDLRTVSPRQDLRLVETVVEDVKFPQSEPT